MTKLTIEIPEKAKKTLLELVVLLGGRTITADSNVNLTENRLLRKEDETLTKFNQSVESINFPAIIFMKFGYHGKEKENDIIQRKKLEFEKTGKIFWGYGGTVCHPKKQVQRFVKEMQLKGKRVYLAMSFTKSKLGNESKSSLRFSVDNSNWIDVPIGIDVRGSKYAIICSELIECKRILNFNNYTVAIGASAGRPASKYIKNRVDKACLIKTNNEQLNPHEIEISLIAEVIEPYAVFMA